MNSISQVAARQLIMDSLEFVSVVVQQTLNGKWGLGENTTSTRCEHRSRRSLSCSYNIY
ncbi:MAG: hypothetical protein ACYTXL_01430 [Nostoc sp.]